MEINPLVEALGEYPYNELADARRAREAKGLEVIDFGIGVPRDPTPNFIRDALNNALAAEPYSSYPLAAGQSELREAIASWVEHRYGTHLDPSIEVLPTLGSKEAIYHLAGLLLLSLIHISEPTRPY